MSEQTPITQAEIDRITQAAIQAVFEELIVVLKEAKITRFNALSWFGRVAFLRSVMARMTLSYQVTPSHDCQCKVQYELRKMLKRLG